MNNRRGKGREMQKEMKKKAKAKARFDETMSRCDALILLYNSTKNDDLLRAVVVFCVAALERYLKDRFLELFVPFLKKVQKRGGNWNKRTKELLNVSGVNEDFWKSCTLNPTKKLFAKIASRVRNYVRKVMILQKKSAIEGLYTCYGMNVIQCAVGKADRKLLWDSVEKLIKRRHQVAHHADYLYAGKLDEIDKKEIEKRIGHVKKLVDCIDDILVLRFKKGKVKAAGRERSK